MNRVWFGKSMTTREAEIGSGGEQLHSGRRVLAVLETIAAQPAGVTPKAISQALQLHLSTCYRLLNTLVAAGYVIRAPSGLYFLGRRVAYLNHRYEASVRPRAEVLAFLHALQLATGETAMLFRLEGNEVVTTAIVEGSRADSHPGEYIGLAGPAYAFAAGRALLAGLPAPQREAIIASYQATPALPWLLPIAPQALRDDLVSIQHKGYAVDHGDGDSGVCCLAAPVRDTTGVVATAAIIAPCARLRGHETRTLPILLEVARAMSALLSALPVQEPGTASFDPPAGSVSQAAIEAAQAAIADAMSRVT